MHMADMSPYLRHSDDALELPNNFRGSTVFGTDHPRNVKQYKIKKVPELYSVAYSSLPKLKLKHLCKPILEFSINFMKNLFVTLWQAPRYEGQ